MTIRFKKKAPPSVVGVELGPTRARFVELTRKGDKLAVSARGAVVFEAGEERGTQLKRALVKAGVKATAAAVSVPRRQVVLRELELPTDDREEVRAMVSLKMERDLPFAASEMVGAIRVLEREGGTSRVLAGYVKRDLLEEQLEVLRGAELKPVCAGVSALLALRALRQSSGFHSGHAQGLVAAGSGLTEIGVLNGDAALTSRAASTGLDRLDLAGGVSAPANRLFLDELDRTFTSFRGGKAPVEAIVLTDEGATAEGFEQLVAERFGVPVSRLHPFDGAVYSSPQTFEDDHQFAVASGAATSALADVEQLDFLDVARDSWLDKLQLDARLLGGIAAVLVLLAVYVVPSMVFGNMQKTIDMHQATLKELKKDNKALSEVKAEVLAMEPWAGERTPWFDAMITLNTLVDNRQAYLTSASFNDSKRTISLSGKARSIQAVSALHGALLKHPGFAPKTPAKSLARGPFPVNFSIEVRLDKVETLSPLYEPPARPDPKPSSKKPAKEGA